MNDERRRPKPFIRDWADSDSTIERDKTIVWGLTMTSDEHATVHEAILKAADTLPTELPGTALAAICGAFLGGNYSVDSLNLDHVVKAAGFFTVMQRLGALYPSVFYHWVCLYDEDDDFFKNLLQVGKLTRCEVEQLKEDLSRSRAQFNGRIGGDQMG